MKRNAPNIEINAPKGVNVKVVTESEVNELKKLDVINEKALRKIRNARKSSIQSTNDIDDNNKNNNNNASSTTANQISRLNGLHESIIAICKKYVAFAALGAVITDEKNKGNFKIVLKKNKLLPPKQKVATECLSTMIERINWEKGMLYIVVYIIVIYI